MRASEDFECAENCLLLYSKTWLLPPPAVVSFLTDSAACVLSFYHSTPLYYYHYYYVFVFVCVLGTVSLQFFLNIKMYSLQLINVQNTSALSRRTRPLIKAKSHLCYDGEQSSRPREKSWHFLIVGQFIVDSAVCFWKIIFFASRNSSEKKGREKGDLLLNTLMMLSFFT